MITFQYVDRFLRVILYLWISNIYKRYENRRNFKGNIIMGTTNITATEIVYQFVFPSPRHHSHYWPHQITPHSSLNWKR